MALPVGMRDPAHRLERECTICRKVDDHPRHLFAGGDGQVHIRHLDCCAGAQCPGAPGAHCRELLAGADGKRGLELAEHLKSLGPNKHAEG